VSRTPPEIAPKYAATYIRDLSVDTLLLNNEAVTVPDSTDFSNPSSIAAATVVGTSSSSPTECHRMTVDWGSGWQNINSVLFFGLVRFGGILGSEHKAGMQESIFCRANRIDLSGVKGSPRGQIWEPIDRPGREIVYNLIANFPAPKQQNEVYLIEAWATYSGSASQGYWYVGNGNITVQGAKR